MEPTDLTGDPGEVLERLQIEVPDVAHAIRCATFASSLFDSLHRRIDLPPSDRRLAVVAALLHDAGYVRGARDHHRKSYDVVNSAFLPGFSRQEQVITACAARYHGRTMPNIEHAGFGEMDMEEQRRTRRLSAIVRLAAACDASHLGVITAVSARPDEQEVTVTITATSEPAVDRERVREAAGGFTALTYVPVRIEIIVATTPVDSEKG